jgi:hypothetical protein
MGSGIDALRLALRALRFAPGDEVIVPAQTFVATYEAVTQAGCVPVVADVGDSDYNLDVAAAEAAITSRTRALMPVHLFGQLADMRAFRELADRRGLLIVEDACQAHGASRDGLRAGEAAEAAAFSFYPGKNLGAIGDAGALTTSDDGVADRSIALREHGQTEKYRHEFEGYTSRLDTIQAAVLLRKLELLDSLTEEAPGSGIYGCCSPGVAISSCRRYPGKAARLASYPVCSAHADSSIPSRERHRDRPSLSATAPSQRRIRVARSPSRIVPGRGTASRAESHAADVPGHRGRPAPVRRCHDQAVLRRCLTSRPTRRRSGCSTT